MLPHVDNIIAENCDLSFQSIFLFLPSLWLCRAFHAKIKIYSNDVKTDFSIHLPSESSLEGPRKVEKGF